MLGGGMAVVANIDGETDVPLNAFGSSFALAFVNAGTM